MKKLRCLLIALVVALSISTVAMAGEIQAPGRSVPAPLPAPANVSGDMQGAGMFLIELLKLAALF